MDRDGDGANNVPRRGLDPLNPGACGVGNFVPFPYPAGGGRYPYFPENAGMSIASRFDGCLRIPPSGPPNFNGWCQRHGLAGDPRQLLQVGATDHASVLVASPVQFLVTQPDGKRFGFTAAPIAARRRAGTTRRMGPGGARALYWRGSRGVNAEAASACVASRRSGSRTT